MHSGSLPKVTILACGASFLIAGMAGVLAPAMTVLPFRSSGLVMPAVPFLTARLSPEE